MNPTRRVDQDAVLRARTMLLGSGELSLVQKLEAYRVLAEVSPRAYLPKLCRALLSRGYDGEFRSRPDIQLALHAEAASAARRIDTAEPTRTALLVDALDAYRYTLYATGRRAEGLAVCEEMAAAARRGFEDKQVTSRAHGQHRLAAVLAEEGRHREAAEIYGSSVQSGDPDDVDFWGRVEWAAELDAAGQRTEALDVFGRLVDLTRRDCAAGGISPAVLTWELVHHSHMFGTAGLGSEARAARKEALVLLEELGRTGEHRNGNNDLDWWACLFALSGRTAEPAASSRTPAPPFGSHIHRWSPDVRHTYFEGIPALEAAAAALAEPARTDPHNLLTELIAVHRRLTIRSALSSTKRTHRILKPLRPVFDEGVTLARRLAGLPAASPDLSRETLCRALTDRSMFLVAAKQHGEAYEDFREAAALVD
ncbi:hypothetical protein LRD69_04235 [Streptomyces sp. JH14]|uniref:hypothetical protein n=1 Tax=Streptomyces sp. JH14 TaxID=2793630 RepID=UPI0023F68A00|nr:hypothetical protein [Streptomyces sp. JH14]MDF6041380.1 hypothetical protein [Streptomyces sp. JH14]